MAVKRTCICCGGKFEYCPTCGGENLPWKRIYDSKECMEIAHALIASRGENGVSKTETKKIMEKYPATLEKIFKYNSLTANSIKELFGVKDEVEGAVVPETEKVEEVVEKEVVSEKPEEKKVEEKKENKFPKTNYYKSNKNK